MNVEEIRQGIEDSIKTHEQLLKAEDILKELSEVVEICVNSLKQGGCIFLCGNGGSAADAQHLAAELTGRYYYDRPPLNAEALHTDTSYITAVANDYGYEHIYSRLVQAKAKKGDVLIAISTSGNSANINNAVQAANKQEVSTIGLTGANGGILKTISSTCLCVPSNITPRIQESHILLGHLLCEGIEKAIFPKND